jgi:hypothetical protein
VGTCSGAATVVDRSTMPLVGRILPHSRQKADVTLTFMSRAGAQLWQLSSAAVPMLYAYSNGARREVRCQLHAYSMLYGHSRSYAHCDAAGRSAHHTHLSTSAPGLGSRPPHPRWAHPATSAPGLVPLRCSAYGRGTAGGSAELKRKVPMAGVPHHVRHSALHSRPCRVGYPCHMGWQRCG